MMEQYFTYYIAMQDLNLEPTWQTIVNQLLRVSEQIIRQVEAGSKITSAPNLIQAYTFVYDRSVEKPSKSELMFSNFKKLLQHHLMRCSFLKDDCNFIKQFNRMWECFSAYAKILIKKVYLYLDRYFLPGRQFGTLQEVAIGLFQKYLLGVPSKRKEFINSFASNLGHMRKTMIITDNHLHTFAGNILRINPSLYGQLKKVYYAETQLFYKVKYHEAENLSPLYYYARIYNLAYFEEALAKLSLLQSAEDVEAERAALQLLFAKQLVQSYTDRFIIHPKGLLWALKQQNLQLLNLVVRIYTRFEGFQRIKKSYYDYVVEQSRVLLASFQDNADETKVINAISQFLLNQNQILTRGFHRHQELHVTLSNALQTAIGRWERLSESLFNYCKTVVNRGDFKSEEQSIRSVFERVANKDEFVHKCEKWMQGIILGERVQLKRQHQFFSFVHGLCGGQNTLKLHKIVTDYLEENADNTIGVISCKILSFHLWERKFKDQIALVPNLPSQLRDIWQPIENEKSVKKKLTLLPLSSKLFLTLNMDAGRTLSIRCNLLQGCIIFALAERGKTMQQLQQEINVEKHLLTAFFDLAKFVSSRDDLFSIDWNFSAEKQLNLDLKVEEDNIYIKAMELDRNHLLQAGIVRVVKRKKEASFEQIFDYLCQHIKLFRPQPIVVKATIEKLMRRDFIETSEQGLYLYKE